MAAERVLCSRDELPTAVESQFDNESVYPQSHVGARVVHRHRATNVNRQTLDNSGINVEPVGGDKLPEVGG